MTPRLAVKNLRKAFGGAQALDGVALQIRRGEIHGLLGHNGSGKSTLIKILAGYHAPDDGELEVDGMPVALPLKPGQFRELGMEFVHQNLGLEPTLSVVDNFSLARMTAPENRWHTSWRAQRQRTRAAFERFGVEIDVDGTIGELRPVSRALVAIVRAVEGISADDGGLLILDEPTVFLPRAETEQLFELLRAVTRAGTSVLFVSHDLEQVQAITDRVTVLRDGRVISTVVTAQTSETELIRLIVGRAVEAAVAPVAPPADGPIEMLVEGLTGGQLVDVSFAVRRGEVLGLTGLLGSGFEDVLPRTYGAHRAEDGTLDVRGNVEALARMAPGRAIELGLALIPADRQHDGSVGSLSALDNLLLPTLGRYASRLSLARRRMERDAAELMRRFDVRPPNPRMTYSAFSGGNQQKLMLAKWLQIAPAVLLLDEPTQGVDVGARQQIFAAIREAAQAGTAVVCASADHEQLAAICTRVIVFGHGRVNGELRYPDISREAIVERCYASAEVEYV
jgi:ribose transport system ATP-binding protein